MMDQTQGWWMAGLPGLKTDMKGGEEEAKGLPFCGSVCWRHARSPVLVECFMTSALDYIQEADYTHNVP